MSDLPTRKPIRLPRYDYNENGGYFLTICTEHKAPFLWKNEALSPLGQLVHNRLEIMARFYDHMIVDKFVVMPNHVHLILMVQPHVQANNLAAVPRFVPAFKRLTVREAGISIWQRSYYDHVIRNDQDYLRIWKYIDENPLKWVDDQYYTP